MRYMGSEVGTFKCDKHGKVDRKVFVVPEPNEGGTAHYECFHCWNEVGRPERSHGTCDTPHKLVKLPSKAEPWVQQPHPKSDSCTRWKPEREPE